MKFSKFVSYHLNGEQTILFNTAKEAVLVLEADLMKIVKQNLETPEKLEKIHPDLFYSLKSMEFIVSNELDEVKSLIQKWENEENDPSNYGIIINPTLNCNLRCWYCYETHKPSEVMGEKTKQAILKFIENKTSDPKLKKLNISFFGGEPLLYFKETVLPILEHASSLCVKKGIQLYSNFTTNGILLNNQIIENLNKLPLTRKATFQITLDGSEQIHNSIRVGTAKKPTYKIILTHIKEALEMGNEVFVRFNYTYDNILTFYDVLDDFKSMQLNLFKDIISIKFEHVWQDNANRTQTRPILKNLRKAFTDENFRVDTDDIHFRHVCYADSPNHLVVNYNGNIFKCTARDFTENNKEGILDENGNIYLNSKFKQRMTIKYNNKECLKCIILPICNGGCSQGKIESGIQDKCYKNMSEEEKLNYLQARMKEVINRHIRQ